MRLHVPHPQQIKDWILALTLRPTSRSAHPISRKTFPFLILISLALLTSAVGAKYYSEPKLVEGTLAPENLVAKDQRTFIDQLQTEQKREEVRNQVLAQYQLNPETTKAALNLLSKRLAEASTLRRLAGDFPFLPTSKLTLNVQQELRTQSSQNLTNIFSILQTETRDSAVKLNPFISANTIQQLTQLKQSAASSQDWEMLRAEIQAAQRRYQNTLNTSTLILSQDLQQQILALSEADWKLVKPRFQTAAQLMLTQGIPVGLPEGIKANALQGHLNNTSSSVQDLGQSLILPILNTNLETDLRNTKRQQDLLAAQVKPVRQTVQKNQIIVRKHEPINAEQFQILEIYGLSQRGINWRGLGLTSLGVAIAISLFHLVHQRTQIPLSRRDYLLLLILSASAPLVAGIQLELTSLPAVGLLVGSLYGSILGGTVIVLITGLMIIGLDTGLGQLLAIALGSFVGSILARQPRSREELALLGLIVALIQGLLYFIVLSVSGEVWYIILGAAIRQGCLGLAWSVATLGISPYLENLFDLVTPIRLAELANPNRPLLKRLAMEAPGTFQHTLFVSTLAEAGARALSCNVELVRTGTLYHDIGKMHWAEAFIENQFGCENLHEALDDPWESANIIKKHVSEGLVMARKYRLPSAVTAFIPEHQGSILIAYFYHQAKQKKQDEQNWLSPESADGFHLNFDGLVQEADFRYAGPTPQSRETGIVMLADACEAALRSLKDVTTEGALQTVNKIFKARWEDQQLVHSCLSRDDLNVLSQVFVEVWQQFHHKRVAYPKRLNTRHETHQPG